jgi:hypothetical protein
MTYRAAARVDKLEDRAVDRLTPCAKIQVFSHREDGYSDKASQIDSDGTAGLEWSRLLPW